MAFGIPGDAVTRSCWGHDHPRHPAGPLFISQEPRIAYGIFAAYLLAHPLAVVIIALGTRMFLRIVTVPKSPSSGGAGSLHVGAYALNNIMDNVGALDLRALRLRAGEVRLSAGAAHPGVILGDQIEVNWCAPS